MSAGPREPVIARLLSSPCLQHDQALAALASAFSGAAGEPPGRRLDESSRRLFGAAGLGVHDQAHALADLLISRLGLVPDAVRPRCPHAVARAILSRLRETAPLTLALRADRLLRSARG